MNKNLSCLYIHIPFCDQICIYCDFCKTVASDKTIIDRYIEALKKEFDYYKDNNYTFDSIYIGGGTPSVLSKNQFVSVLSHLSKTIDFKTLKEFTIEANPNDINEDTIDKIKYLKENYNLNRISLGVQSFNDKKTLFMKRKHNKEESIKAIKLLQSIGLTNINVDLIYGFPMDNYKLIKNDLKTCIKNNVKHISYYSLILEDKTELSYLKGKNLFKELDDDTEANLYYKIVSYLKRHKYYSYETSNFSFKNNYKCYYNNKVWSHNEYLGIGASASSFINNTRFSNINDIIKYIDLINNNDFNNAKKENILLNDKELLDEEIMLALRKTSGFNIENINNKFNIDFKNYYKNYKILLDNKLLIEKDNNVFINPKKFYIQNSIIIKLLEG